MAYLGDFNEDENEIKSLESQLAASRKREEILREGLAFYSSQDAWYEREDFDTDGSSLGFVWEYYGNGPSQARLVLKAAEEVK